MENIKFNDAVGEETEVSQGAVSIGREAGTTQSW